MLLSSSWRVTSVEGWNKPAPSKGRSSFKPQVSKGRLVECNQECCQIAKAMVSVFAAVSKICFAEVISCLAAPKPSAWRHNT